MTIHLIRKWLERTYIARDDTKDGPSPCFSDVIALATGQMPDVEGEIAALVTPDVCFPSGPSCFSSISDFTTPAVCFPHGSPSFSRSRRLRRFPRLPHVNKHLTTSRDYRRNDFSSCLVDNVSPLCGFSLDLLAYEIRISSAELPPTFFHNIAAYQAVSFFRWLSILSRMRR